MQARHIANKPSGGPPQPGQCGASTGKSGSSERHFGHNSPQPSPSPSPQRGHGSRLKNLTTRRSHIAEPSPRQNLKTAPIFLPKIALATASVAARNSIAHTPKAQAMPGPEPRICASS